MKFSHLQLLATCCSLLFGNLELQAQKYTISGIVKDSISGENLTGAHMIIEGSQAGVGTNAYGFYSISLSKGVYKVAYSYLGYSGASKLVTLDKNIRVDITLQELKSELREVVVRANKSNTESANVSHNDISIERIKTVSSLSGEPDVLKTLQLLPGIQAVNDGNTNLYVRGGSQDQNLFLLDEAPVYNPAHALGFFSAFNSDALKNVSIYKGCYPVQYGGRLSSVVDVLMREGNNNHTAASVGLGLIASRITVEGPIAKGKASYIVSGRYSYPGTALNIMSQLMPNTLSDDNKVWFYDMNLKMNYKIDSNNHVYVSAYSGYDNFYCQVLNNKNEMNWGNLTTTARWNHVFSSKLFANFTLYHSNYNYAYTIREDIRNFIWKSNVVETGAKADLSYFVNPNNAVKYGLSAISRSFAPGSISQANATSIIKAFSLDKKHSAELSAYVQNDQTVSEKLLLNYGLRTTLFVNYGPATVYTYSASKSSVIDSSMYRGGELVNSYYGLEPRFSARYLLNKSLSVKLAYANTRQFLHLLSNSTVGLPTDVWLPADKHIRPESSNQYVAGLYTTMAHNTLDFSIELYYKQLYNIIDFIDNANLFLNKHVETQVLQGGGRSFGTELLLEKKEGRLSGWIGYTLAKTEYKIPGINNGNYYSPRYDIRHNLSLTGSYQLNKVWTFSSTFKLASGGFISMPQQLFYVDGASFFDYGSRNSYKMPAYHRLDFSVIFRSRKNEFRRYKDQWVLSVFNVYGRRNIYSLFVKQSYDLSHASATKMYLYTIVPTLSYNVKF
jgi:hypothetical protein